MINFGSHGSINLFYKGILISSFPLSKKKRLVDYEHLGTTTIIDTNTSGMNIKHCIGALVLFCNQILKRKINKQGIRRTDHQLFSGALFALLRLKVIENDDENGYLIMPYKKLSNHLSVSP
tara:strand:+ start:10393 stop:10755 length:363 start_codon:yes stop_codon:yes gene_type:complete